MEKSKTLRSRLARLACNAFFSAVKACYCRAGNLCQPHRKRLAVRLAKFGQNEKEEMEFPIKIDDVKLPDIDWQALPSWDTLQAELDAVEWPGFEQLLSDCFGTQTLADILATFSDNSIDDLLSFCSASAGDTEAARQQLSAQDGDLEVKKP